MGNVTIALALHLLAIVLWVGGVAMATTVLLPAVRQFKGAEDRIAFFKTVQRRFAWQACFGRRPTGDGRSRMIQAKPFDRYANGWMLGAV